MKFILMPPLGLAAHFDAWVGDGAPADVAVLAEQVGFDAIAETDHPFPSSAFVEAGGHHSLDLFVSLSYHAAATARLQVMTDIMVAGYRNPYLAAKACATLDKLSGGRLIVGMAAGYVPDEFAALGGSFEKRGSRFDDAIRAMRAAWTGEVVNQPDGHFPAQGHIMAPPPAQPGGPPIWIGGNSERAMRRAVELGDGWMPMPANDSLARFAGTDRLDSIAELAKRVAEAQKRRRDLGKPDLEINFGTFSYAPDPEARFKQMARDLPAYEDAGVTSLTALVTGRTIKQTCEQVERFAEVVIANVSTR